ncbi:RnfH family protein [Alcanivorax sp. 1008]|uniref:RnfH family protein n=1 Tax=Alcanivorax sp. 1008 TaxID=2816853 RepID=UPI001D739757|nr:RnfH family protein [Alcanivorax sp. 1008]MCC1497052.1 RnfH family protein [Alcanivorax sp. 1008]
MNDELLNVEVVYALPDRQKLISLRVPVGATMYDAVQQSGIIGFFPELDIEHSSMGVFSKVEANPKGRVLAEGERVEIYRPLIIDPKDNRKARAKQAKEKRSGQA